MFTAALFTIARTWKQPRCPSAEEQIKTFWYVYTMECCCCCCLVAKLYMTLCNPMDCSPSGSSVHEISPARILEWVVISSFRQSSWTRDWTHISCIGRQILYHWVNRDAHNRIFLSHKKEQIWNSCSEMDEPRAYYTKWNKSEREKQILCINTYIWNLEK